MRHFKGAVCSLGEEMFLLSKEARHDLFRSLTRVGLLLCSCPTVSFNREENEFRPEE